jgi:threonine dehydrogenase-like Zn-dependent dehydrogenase
MSKLMNALVVRSPDEFGVEQIPVPLPTKDEALIKVFDCAICGSDITLIRGHMEDIRFPLVPGHEWSGEVIDAPESPGLVGKRVISNLLQNCKHCLWCHRRLPNLCPNLTEPGISVSGAYAQYMTVRAREVIPLPDDMPLSVACLVEPLAVVLYALRRTPIELGDHVIIFGGGGIGQLLSQACRASGAAKVVVVDHHPARIQMALRMGADAAINGNETDVGQFLKSRPELTPNVGFEACGNPDAFARLLDIIEPAGRVGVIGYSGNRKVSIAPSIFMRKLLEVRGALSPTGTWDQAVEMIRRGAVRAAPLISHRFALSQFPQAFEIASRRADGALRVVIEPWRD